MTNDDAAWPTRPQRRYLRRIYNGRTVPILADEQEFLTYKHAMKYLQMLDQDACEAAYEQMKCATKQDAIASDPADIEDAG